MKEQVSVEWIGYNIGHYTALYISIQDVKTIWTLDM